MEREVRVPSEDYETNMVNVAQTAMAMIEGAVTTSEMQPLELYGSTADRAISVSSTSSLNVRDMNDDGQGRGQSVDLGVSPNHEGGDGSGGNLEWGGGGENIYIFE